MPPAEEKNKALYYPVFNTGFMYYILKIWTDVNKWHVIPYKNP